MDTDEQSISDFGSALGRVSRRSSHCSGLSRRGSSVSGSSINIDDLSLLSESFPARLWHRWMGLVGGQRLVVLVAEGLFTLLTEGLFTLLTG